MNDAIPNIETFLKDRLELPRGILVQLRDTCLFNEIIDQAIADIDSLIEKGPDYEK